MANAVYNSAKVAFFTANLDLVDDTIHGILVTGSYTPDIDAHEFRDDITNEITGTGYTAGGQAMTTKVVTKDNTNDRAVWSSDDLVWSTATFTAAGMVQAKIRGGAASADELIQYLDFGGNVTATGADFTVAVNALGWMYLGDA